MNVSKCPICNFDQFSIIYNIDHRTIVKCKKCGFVFAGRYDENLLDNLYKETYYKSSDDPKIENWLEVNRLVWNGLVNFVSKNHKKPIRKILDIGTGCGGFVFTFKEKFPKVELYATEQSKEAREFVRNKNNQIHFVDENLLLDNYNSQFDAICLFQVLEHVEDLSCIFKVIRNSLSENGTLFLTVPNVNSYRAILHNVKDGFCYGNKTHLSFFSQKDIKTLLNQNGFKNICRIKSFGGSNVKGYRTVFQWVMRLLGISSELRFIATK